MTHVPRLKRRLRGGGVPKLEDAGLLVPLSLPFGARPRDGCPQRPTGPGPAQGRELQ